MNHQKICIIKDPRYDLPLHWFVNSSREGQPYIKPRITFRAYRWCICSPQYRVSVGIALQRKKNECNERAKGKRGIARKQEKEPKRQWGRCPPLGKSPLRKKGVKSAAWINNNVGADTREEESRRKRTRVTGNPCPDTRTHSIRPTLSLSDPPPRCPSFLSFLFFLFLFFLFLFFFFWTNHEQVNFRPCQGHD